MKNWQESVHFLELSMIEGFPAYLYSGDEGNNTVLVMELLGINIEDLLTFCGSTFSIKTTLMLAEQMVT